MHWDRSSSACPRHSGELLTNRMLSLLLLSQLHTKLPRDISPGSKQRTGGSLELSTGLIPLPHPGQCLQSTPEPVPACRVWLEAAACLQAAACHVQDACTAVSRRNAVAPGADEEGVLGYFSIQAYSNIITRLVGAHVWKYLAQEVIAICISLTFSDVKG